jgi:hypothetical protein
MKVVAIMSALFFVSTGAFAAENRLASYAPQEKTHVSVQKPAPKAPAKQKAPSKRGIQGAMEWQLQNPQLG